MNDMTLSRRQFVVTSLTAAGGFALGIGMLNSAEAATLSAVRPWNDDSSGMQGEINAWVVIQPDDTVIIRYGRAEMGQGSFTTLPQILAEELECDWALVKPEYASANRNFRENKVYGTLSTGGSRAVREQGALVQQAGASARERLIAAAAQRWNVPATECAAAMSKVTHTPSGRTFRFGELAVQASAIKLDKEPALKRPDQYKFIGRRLPRLDIPHKVNGAAKFGIDLDVPNMVRAAIIKCSGVRRHGEIGRRKRDRRDARRPGRQAQQRGRRRGGSVLPRSEGAQRAEDRVGGRRCGHDEQRAVPQGICRSLGSTGHRRASRRQRRCRAGGRRQDDRSDLRRADHCARADGAAERHRACAGRSCRRMGRHAKRRRRADDGSTSFGHGARESLHPQHVLRRRLRPASRSRRGFPGRCDLQGGRQAGEAHLDARGRDPAGPLPHAGRDPLQGGVCRRRNAGRA